MSKKQQGHEKPQKDAINNDPKTGEESEICVPFIIHRSRAGLKLLRAIDGDDVCKGEIVLCSANDKSDRVESVCCSEDGELLAWCDNNNIKCIRFSTQEVVFEVPNTSRSNCLMISPKSTKIVTFNTMSGGDNLHFWNIKTQSHLSSKPFRKATQWKPLFSMNEDICIQHSNGELCFYAGKFEEPKQRISHLKITDFSLSTASHAPSSSYQHIYAKRVENKTHYIAIYAAGSKGQPSIVKIYKYPNMTDCVTNKSFFKADSVKFSWSPSGNSLLLTCQADFDKSGKSYFGEQSLNYMNVRGDSYYLKLPKEGTIHNIEWEPRCDRDRFVCVYGLMPARASLFNDKGEVVFHFGDPGSFNGSLFSPFGNLIAIYGFGNLAGQLNIWDSDKKRVVSSLKAPETTGIEWSPDGKHLLTCTTAPRLRVGNGFRLWHCTGKLIYEVVGSNDPAQNLEIYDVLWQPMPGKFKKPKVNMKESKQLDMLSQSKLGKFQGSAGKYVPPSERNSTTSSRPGYIDAAEGKSGGRLIVGLESLNLSNQKNFSSKPKKSDKTSGPNK